MSRALLPPGLRRRAVVISVAAIVALPLAGAVAYAAVPDGGGVIHGCHHRDTGMLRVIDPDSASRPGEGCRPAETPLSWNQSGPAGPVGPQGPTGPAGPAGFSGYVQREYSFTPDPGSLGGSLLARCEPGELVIGGGLRPILGGVTMTWSAPRNDTSWLVGFRTGEVLKSSFEFYAVCVDDPRM